MRVQILHAGISHPSPYFYNFCEALRLVDPLIGISINPDIPNNTPKKGSILHFHRLKRFYDSENQETAEKFIENLRNAKKDGWGVAWTVHNFFPIDRPTSSIDFFVTARLSELADVIFTHTELMRTNAERLFSREVINCSYGINRLEGIFDVNGLCLSKDKDETIFSFGGNIAGYKCLPKCIEDFQRLKEKYEERRLRLIIAGPSSRNSDLEALVRKDLNILFYNFFIGDSAWKELCKVTDVFLGAYDTSLPAFRYGFFPSSVPQFLSYKKPIILPNCPEIREFISQENMAILYNPSDQNGLFNAMEEGLNPARRNLVESTLRKISKEYSWEKVAEIVIHGYRSIL